MAANSLASSADCADALLSARRAKDILIGLILLVLLFQLGLFFAARYKLDLQKPSVPNDAFRYAVGVTDFAGVILPTILAVILLLMILVMILGRTLGIASLVSAFIACVVLAALLFPWQTLLVNQMDIHDNFIIPGVLYTWPDLVARARLHPDDFKYKALFWARFVGWPVAALLITVSIQWKSAAGLRAALTAPAPQPIDTPVTPPGTIQ